MANIPYKPDLTTERGRHLHWCKTRAFEYLDKGDVKNALASFLSDIRKNKETENIRESPLIFIAMSIRNESELRRFIEGFN